MLLDKWATTCCVAKASWRSMLWSDKDQPHQLITGVSYHHSASVQMHACTCMPLVKDIGVAARRAARFGKVAHVTSAKLPI